MTVLLGQGYMHQVVLMRQKGQTGAVSLRLHQFFFIKDVSTIVFALTMGLRTGWPLLLLSSVSGMTKVITLWQYRRLKRRPLKQGLELGPEDLIP